MTFEFRSYYAACNFKIILVCFAMFLSLHAAGASAQAYGEDESAKGPEQNELDEIIVTARFIDLSTTGATKLPMAIAEVPQSVSLVSEGFLNVTNLNNIGELADYVPGLTHTGQVYNFRPSVKSRGFVLGNLYGFKLNGYRWTRLEDFDEFLFERIEVVRGPSSATYGIGNPGGLINYVLRSPSAEPEGHLDFQVGSWDKIGIRARQGGPLNEDGTARGLLMATGHQADGQMDFYFDNNLAVAGVLEYDFTEDFTVKTNLIKKKGKSRAADGVPLFSSDGSPPPVLRSLFLGNRDTDESNQTNTFVSLEADWRVSDKVRLGMNGAGQKGYFDVTLTFPFNIQDNGDTSFRSFEFFTDERTYNAELFIEWAPEFWGREQVFRLSLAYDERTENSVNRSAAANGNFLISSNIFRTAEEIYNDVTQFKFETPLSVREFKSTSEIGNFQAVLRPLENLTVVASIAVNDASTFSQVGTSITEFNFPNEPSYRLGATYSILDNFNVYASWSDSFTPQTFLDINDQPLDPLSGTQVEAGVKVELFDRRLLLTAAVFNLEQTNSPRLIPGVTPERYETFGEVEHEGWEIEAIGQITPNWSLYASLDDLDPKVTVSDNPTQIGPTRPFIPTSSASIFTTYRLSDGPLHGLTFGGGARHVGEMHTDFTGSTRDIDSYTVVDAVLIYEIGEKSAIRLNVNNVFDETYRLATYNSIFFGLRFGDPRNYLVTFSHYW